MKTFEQYNIKDEQEKIFLELAHLDELDIKFNFFEYKDKLFYLYKNECLFYNNKIKKDFYINGDKIWNIFEIIFNMYRFQMYEFMIDMIEKYFDYEYSSNSICTFENIFIEKL